MSANYAVMPVRNGLAMTKVAIADLFAQDIGYVRPWVLSNGSTDGTNEWLRAQSEVMATFHSARHSVSASWNKALDYLFTLKNAPYVLVVNNDVRLRPDTYRALVEANLPFATAVGVSTEEQLNEPFVPAHRSHPDFSCYLIRRECWDKVGRFDEGFAGAYYEDNDYHVRMFRAGIDAMCIGMPFLHYGSGTIKAVDAKTRESINEQSRRNGEYFFRKYGCRPATKEYEALFNREGNIIFDTP